MQKPLRLLVLAAACAASVQAIAGTPSAAASETASAPSAQQTLAVPIEPASAPAPVVATVQKISNGQATIEHAFKAPLGLIGMAVNLGAGRNTIMYASPDGKYFIMGGIFGSEGQNYTMAAAQKYLPPPPPPPNVESNFASLKDTKTFVWGSAKAKKEIWMLADPNCIFCHKMFVGLKPFVDKGDVKVNVIMAGFLKPDSLGKAAAIYSSKDPVKAFIKDETEFDDAHEEGGVKPDLKNKDAVEAIKANNAWMQQHGIGGTPYILFVKKDGKPGVMPGYTADVKGMLDGVR